VSPASRKSRDNADASSDRRQAYPRQSPGNPHSGERDPWAGRAPGRRGKLLTCGPFGKQVGIVGQDVGRYFHTRAHRSLHGYPVGGNPVGAARRGQEVVPVHRIGVHHPRLERLDEDFRAEATSPMFREDQDALQAKAADDRSRTVVGDHRAGTAQEGQAVAMNTACDRNHPEAEARLVLPQGDDRVAGYPAVLEAGVGAGTRYDGFELWRVRSGRHQVREFHLVEGNRRDLVEMDEGTHSSFGWRLAQPAANVPCLGLGR